MIVDGVNDVWAGGRLRVSVRREVWKHVFRAGLSE